MGLHEVEKRKDGGGTRRGAGPQSPSCARRLDTGSPYLPFPKSQTPTTEPNQSQPTLQLPYWSPPILAPRFHMSPKRSSAPLSFRPTRAKIRIFLRVTFDAAGSGALFRVRLGATGRVQARCYALCLTFVRREQTRCVQCCGGASLFSSTNTANPIALIMSDSGGTTATKVN